MNRKQFFQEIGKRSDRYIKVGLLICFLLMLALRVIDTEFALKIAIIIFLMLITFLFAIPLKLIDCVYLLHAHQNKHNINYKKPALVSLCLVPQSIVVSVGVIAPPFIFVYILFGLSTNQPEHTELLSYFLLLQALAVWFYGVVRPAIFNLCERVSE